MMKLSRFRYFYRLYRGEYPALAFSIVLSIIQSILVLPIAFLVRRAFDEVIPSGDLPFLILIGSGILLLNFTNHGLTLWIRYLTLKTNKRAVKRLRDRLVGKCYSFSRSYYSRADRSRLHAVIVQDTERLDWMSNALVALFLPALAVCVGLSGVLIYLNWFLFLLLVLVVPVLLLVSRIMKKKVVKKTNAFHRAFESFSIGISFMLKNLDLTKIQTAEIVEKKRQRKSIESVEASSRAMAWLNAAYTSVQNGIVIISGILILIFGGLAVSRGSMTLGSLLSFYVGVSLMNRYLKVMLSSIPHIIEGTESLDTLNKIIQIKNTDPYKGRKKITFRGNITLDSVSFQYGKEPVLRNLNLRIPAHSTIALSGPNGSGKSTVAHLILGFYKPQSGRLFADGIPYSEMDIPHLRRFIGVVMQNPVLLPDTIWENITYGIHKTKEQDVIQAVKTAEAYEFIRELPDGFQTFCGEEGILLSGGERQRIAVARALLRKPKLLILDEPFNHLDYGTGPRIMRNIQNMDECPSMLVISHDAVQVEAAQKIYFLDHFKPEGACGSGLPDAKLRQG